VVQWREIGSKVTGMMTFYKLWLKEVTKNSAKTDKTLYDLTSISYYGSNIDAAEYGYNRDCENLPQVNYALLCMRSTAMPLFAWPMNGSISDMGTLETTLLFLKKLQFMPDCLMMDRGFCSGSARDKYVSTEENIEVIDQYPCKVHVLFCQDLIGSQHDKFMDKLKAEHDRLVADEDAELHKEFAKYIKVYR
jgi:transposase